MDEVNYTIQMEYETYEVPDSVPFYAHTPEIPGNRFIPANFQFAAFD